MKDNTVQKKPNIFKRMGKGIKEIISELKKVSWPKAAQVFAATGVVLAVVFFFLVAIGVFDFGLSFLLDLLTGR